MEQIVYADSERCLECVARGGGVFVIESLIYESHLSAS